MNKIYLFFFTTISLTFLSTSSIPPSSDYLSEIKSALKKEWPDNKTINLVFHGHSVPAGYFKTPVVNTFDAYPYQLLKELKKLYPTAVINTIVTSIGGENSVEGEKRFESEVLTHRPDVLFIDYALNDRRVGLEKSHQAWSHMIKLATNQGIKVILLTPSPDLRVDILARDNVLEQHAEQIRKLSQIHAVGLVDSYQAFKQKAVAGDSLVTYMSQVNHPNAMGHQLITDENLEYFR